MSMSDREARRRWKHAGLECAMIDSCIGFINGYVRLSDDHIARGQSYDVINRTVGAHGGLSYGVDDDGWVGFDTGHSGDYWPGITDEARMFGPANRTWDIERLTSEVESLADQLAAMTSLGEPDDKWDCTDEEFAALVADAKAWREHVAGVTR